LAYPSPTRSGGQGTTGCDARAQQPFDHVIAVAQSHLRQTLVPAFDVEGAERLFLIELPDGRRGLLLGVFLFLARQH
jgi:hypothetical protein